MDARKDSVMYPVYVAEATADYTASVEIHGRQQMHRYGCSGIDGLAFAPAPGKGTWMENSICCMWLMAFMVIQRVRIMITRYYFAMTRGNGTVMRHRPIGITCNAEVPENLYINTLCIPAIRITVYRIWLTTLLRVIY